MIKRMMRRLEVKWLAFCARQLSRRGYRIFSQVTKSQWKELLTGKKFAILRK